MSLNPTDSGKDKIESFTTWVRSLDGEVSCLRDLPPAKASYGGWGGLDSRISAVMGKRGITSLYSHQSRAVSLAMDGRDVVVVTPTASGKTLCYNLPVADAVLNDSSSRALYLFPTKALAHDQSAELEELSAELGGAVKCFTYDGDTPAAKRIEARAEGNVIITNPDMLHVSMLPYHDRWRTFFSGLKYVVVDEVHMYRGIFGSHMANLFARLERVCRHYGAHPVFICCSATIANPAEHASALTGRKTVPVAESGAPSPARKFMIYNPRVIDKRTGLRRSSLFESARFASEALSRGISTIVFTRSRLNVELILKTMRGMLSAGGIDSAAVTGYRSGYLPAERRAIERGLRSGKILGVVSTNALELGIDIGSLDMVVLHGYPGSISSAWQQIGRAGRRGSSSLSIIVASSAPIDQFMAARPSWFFGASPERARIAPLNPYILAGHVKCSAFEHSFLRGEKFCGLNIDEILSGFAERGVLKAESGGIYSWQGASFPAASVSLRSGSGESYDIVDVTDRGRPHTVGNMERSSAPSMIFPGAIYFHRGHSYVVERLDDEKLTCFVKRSACGCYTESVPKLRAAVRSVCETKGSLGWGDVTLTFSHSMYRKIRLSDHEIVGCGEIKAPEYMVETTGCWMAVPSAAVRMPRLECAMDGLAGLIRRVAPLFLMCDKSDMQVFCRMEDPYLKKPALFFCDSIPGGVGLAEGIFELGMKLVSECRALLDSCKCRSGCPACIGVRRRDESDAKEIVRVLIDSMLLDA